MDSYFTPLAAGDLRLPNRIVMSPLTRMRAVESRTPNALMRDYTSSERRRADHLRGDVGRADGRRGYPNTPGIWNEAQVAGWR